MILTQIILIFVVGINVSLAVQYWIKSLGGSPDWQILVSVGPTYISMLVSLQVYKHIKNRKKEKV